jgi:hypothetical protein
MYHLLSSSLPSIRTWDKLNAETPGGKAYIAKLNELTESELTELSSSMVDESALAMWKKQGSWGIRIVSLQRKIIVDIQFNRY